MSELRNGTRIKSSLYIDTLLDVFVLNSKVLLNYVPNVFLECTLHFELLFHDTVASCYDILYISFYSGTPLIRTPLGPTTSVLIRGVSSFQGLHTKVSIFY